MKTISVSIENLCVPCHCGCRHCLLSSQHCATGVDYHRGQAFAARFYDWMRENRPDLSGLFYVGYCNEFPELKEHIAFVKKYVPGYDFLQFNGLAFRSEAEIKHLLETVKAGGIRLIDLTFYGLREYHDRFAGRKGDFDFLLRILRMAENVSLDVAVSIPLTMENAGEMEPLFAVLAAYKVKQYSVFLPHDKGRGAGLAGQRVTKAVFDSLPQTVRDNFIRIPHKTEGEWLAMDRLPTAETRALTLALTPENMDRLETMDPGRIIRELEAMDDAWYAAVPSAEELARTYGRPENTQLFRFRDLYLHWQKQYLRDHPLDIPDMNDERHSFSTRIYRERS